MTKHRLHIFIAFVLVLLIIAGLCALLTNGNENDEPEEAQTPAPTSSPAESSAPEETAEPTATPEPTPEPTPEETLDPSVPVTRELDLSGDFASTSGTNLNIGVKWNAVSRNDETIRLSVDVYLYSYAMHCGPVDGSVSVNGETKSFVSDAISYDSTEKLQALKLQSMVLDLPISVGETVSVPISAQWNFSGQYNGKDIDGLSVEQYIEIAG